MRPVRVVILDPVSDCDACIIQVEEQRLVRELVTHTTDQRLRVSVLHRPAGGVAVQLTPASLHQASMALLVSFVPRCRATCPPGAVSPRTPPDCYTWPSGCRSLLPVHRADALLSRLRTRLGLPHNPDDLLFRGPRPLRRLSSPRTEP